MKRSLFKMSEIVGEVVSKAVLPVDLQRKIMSFLEGPAHPTHVAQLVEAAYQRGRDEADAAAFNEGVRATEAQMHKRGQWRRALEEEKQHRLQRAYTLSAPFRKRKWEAVHVPYTPRERKDMIVAQERARYDIKQMFK